MQTDQTTPAARTRQLEVAVAAVRQAARVTQAVQRDLVTADTLTKRDRSPVTVADFASQAVVCRALAEAFPSDPVVGEEDAHELRTPAHAELRASVARHVRAALGQPADEAQVLAWIDHGSAPADPAGRYWTLDPIDGTKGFLRGEQYAIALALIEDGEVVLAVLGCPNLSGPVAEWPSGRVRGGAACVFHSATWPLGHWATSSPGIVLAAVRGRGTHALPLAGDGLAAAQAVRVGGVSDPAAARFCESVEAGHSDQSQAARIARRLGITAEPLRMDSQAKYATVARGDASIYLRLPTRPDYREKIWDHAAGMLVVTEAGGTVTDALGRPLDFSRGRQLEQNQGIIATNGPIHAAVVAAVSEVMGQG